MDESAPITWLIDQINTIVSAGSASAAGAIAGAVAPIASACFGIYVLLMTISYMRGSETEPVIDFMLKMAAWALIIGFGLNADNYNSTVAPIVTGLGGDLSNAVSGGTVTASTLDQLALFYLDIINAGWTAAQDMGLAGIATLMLVTVKIGIILLGLVPFLVAATLAIVAANVGSQIIAMVGPLFFAFLLFPATRQYFSAWVSSALSYALVPLLVAVVATISVGISKSMLTAGGQDLISATFKDVFLAAIGNLVLLFVLRQVSALASSLSAGGINAALPGSLGTLAHAITKSIAGSGRQMKGMQQMYQGGKDLASAIKNRFNSVRKAG